MARPLITGCLIAKDEEATIRECLSRLWKVVDEIVVVDTGSTDSTVDIAKSMGAHVFSYPWRNDFSAARNYALSLVSHPWVFMIDADEFLDDPPPRLLEQLEEADGYYVNLINVIEDEQQEHQTISRRVSLFRNDPRFRYEGVIHEAIKPAILRAGGTVKYLPITLRHVGYQPSVRTAKEKTLRNRRLIEQELNKRSGDPLLNFYLAQECFAGGELEDAVRYYRRALLRLEPKSNLTALVVLRLMTVLLRLGRYSEALELHERHQRHFMDYTDLHYLAGVLAGKVGDYGRAQRELLTAISLGDASVEKYEFVTTGYGTFHAWTALGDLHIGMGNEKDALLCLTQALRANPRFGPAIASLTGLTLKHDPPEVVLAYIKRFADLDHPTCAKIAWKEFFQYQAFDQCDEVARALPLDEQGFLITLTAIRRGNMGEVKQTLLSLAASETLGQAAKEVGILVALETGDVDWGSRLLTAHAEHGQHVAECVFLDLLGPAVDSPHDAVMPRAPMGDGKKVIWRLVERAVELGLVNALEQVGVALGRYGEDAGHRALQFGKILWRHKLLDAAVEQCLRAGLEGVYDQESLLIIAQHAMASDNLPEAVSLLRKVIAMGDAGPLPYAVLARLLMRSNQEREAREVLQQGVNQHPTARWLLDVSATEQA